MSLRRVLSICALGATLAFLAGCSSNSNGPTAADIPTDNSAPSAPVVLGSHPNTVDGTDVLSWQPSASANVTGYEVYMYSPDPARDNSYELLGVTRGPISQYELPASDAGTVQYFRVKAVSASGVRSAASATSSITRSAFVGGGGHREPGPGMHEGE